MSAESSLFYEDLVPGGRLTSPAHVIGRDELVSFARTWDPLPFHVDEEAGVRAFGGLTAPGLFVLAVKQRLVHHLKPLAVIASTGYDEVRFLVPLRPGDTVVLHMEWVSRRVSNTRRDRGLVTIRFCLVNQAGATVMSHLDTVLVRLRFPPMAGSPPPPDSAAFASS